MVAMDAWRRGRRGSWMEQRGWTVAVDGAPVGSDATNRRAAGPPRNVVLDDGGAAGAAATAASAVSEPEERWGEHPRRRGRRLPR